MTSEHYDAIIIGAGLSGISAGYHLLKECPETRFLVLEWQSSFGGTWRLHRYPGVRSDSELYTFGYKFKPWIGPPLATAEEILIYMGSVIRENSLEPHIRYGHRVDSASWSSVDNRWQIKGYYRNTEGFTPEWPQMADFTGQIVHPQVWPEGLSLQDRRVLVIGSGATAATLIPAIAEQVQHITMLQRSPTYYIIGHNAMPLADELRELEVDESWIHEIVRRKVFLTRAQFTRRSFEESDAVKKELLAAVHQALPAEYPDFEEHFVPSYRPWQQRLAFIPDGDLFKCIGSGKLSIVTGEVLRFNECGVLTKTAKGEQQLDADVVITATGFNLNVMGDIKFSVDEVPVDFAETVSLQGMMLSGVPNFAFVFGYVRSSWTLKSDLVSEFVCKLLRHMEAHGWKRVTPTLSPEDRDLPLHCWIDPHNFNPGYMGRAMHLFPKRSTKDPWVHTQDHDIDRRTLPNINLEDPVFDYL